MNEGLLPTMDQWMLNFLEDIHTTIPGRIERYSGHKERRARVVPLVRPWLQNGTLVEIKPIDDVPVVFPSSAAGSILFPLKAGDGVLLTFSEVGIGNYLHGRANTVADADDPSRFSLSDCVALPGLFPFAGVPSHAPAEDRPWFGSADGAFLALKKKVHLANASSDLRTELEAVWDAVLDLYTQMSTLAPLTTAPGNPTTPNPAQVTALTAAKAQATTRKGKVSAFLE